MYSYLYNRYNDIVFHNNVYTYLGYTLLLIILIEGIKFVINCNDKMTLLEQELLNLKNIVKINNIKINKYQDNLLLYKNKVDDCNINKEQLIVQCNKFQNNLDIVKVELNKKIDILDEQNSFILLGFEDYHETNNFYRQRYFFNHKNCTNNELFNNIKGNYRKHHFYYIILSQLKFLPNIMKNGIYLKHIVNPSIIIITNNNSNKLTEYDINNFDWFHDKNNTISFFPGINNEIYSSNISQIEKLEILCSQYDIKLLKDEDI